MHDVKKKISSGKKQLRNRSRKVLSQRTDQKTIDAAWEQAFPGRGIDQDLYRKDFFGAWMKKSNFGSDDEFGWSIDAHGDFPQPLHWKNIELKSRGLLD